MKLVKTLISVCVSKEHELNVDENSTSAEIKNKVVESPFFQQFIKRLNGFSIDNIDIIEL